MKLIATLALRVYLWSRARADRDADYLANESAEIEAALMRRFDIASVWNASINRAIERKRAAREQFVLLTGIQELSFKRQQESTRSALRNA